MVPCSELGSPTSEAQARHLAGAPRLCQPHSSEENGGKKERKKERERGREKERKKERKGERKEGRKKERKNKVIKI